MTRILMLVATALLLGGCGGEGEASGEPIEVAEALESGGDVVSVRGLLYSDDLPADGDGPFTLRLCSALAESFPPQCGEPSLTVANAAYTPGDLTREGEVGWSDEPVVLTGTVEDGSLTLVDTLE